MKKALSMLLVLVMLIGMMPMQVFATEGTQETEAVEVVTEPSEAPEEETTAPAEETEPSEEIETEEPSDEEEETESPDEEEEEESSEPSEPEEEPEVVHEHDYEAVVTDPTCTEQGYTTYTCECGDSYVDDYVDAEGAHDFTDWHTTKEATYQAAGEESRECKKCSHVEFRSVELEVVTSGNVGYGTPYTDDVTYTLYADGTMVIAGSGKVYCSDWRGNNQPYYAYRDQVKNLIIEEGVTQTTGGCFAYFVNLESVSIPASLTRINKNAFMNSFVSSLKTITIPETVTYIADFAFGFYSGASSATFTDIIIENPNVSFFAGKEVFNSGKNLQNLTLYSYGAENNVRTYAETYGCRYIDLNDYQKGEFGDIYYEVSSGVLRLDPLVENASIPADDQPWASFNDKIAKIVISEGITEIPDYAFADYPALTEVELPYTIQTIGDGAFAVSESNNTPLAMALPRRLIDLGDDLFAGRNNVNLTVYYGSLGANLDEIGVSLEVKKEFKLLLIGNSYSEDASNGSHTKTSQLLDILQSMLGPDADITVALLYSGGKGMHWHATQAEQGNKAYSFKVITTANPTWKSMGSYTSANALAWTDWDAVSLQPYDINVSTGQESVPYPETTDPKFYHIEDSSTYLLDHVARYAPDADIYFYMHWARTSGTVLNAVLSSYNKAAAFMPRVLEYAGTESGAQFKTIIPVGLSIQNARTTYLALLSYNPTAYADKNLNLQTDAQIGLQRDGGHVSFNIGRYIAGLTFAEMIIPQEWRVDGYVLPEIRITESVGKLPKEYSEIAQKAVLAAVNGWKNGSLTVTNIDGYTVDPTVSGQKKLEAVNLAVTCAAADEMIQQIREAVLVELPADFSVDAVVIDKENKTAAVTIRFGYTSVETMVSWEIQKHQFENGVCAGCGKEEIVSKPMSMRYDDHLDMTGKTVEILDAGIPTSYQVGYGVEENKVLDSAVVTLKGSTLVATGIGTAKVKIDGETYEITVTAAPISLLLLIGQSNAEGMEGNANQSVVCPDGMVYSTYAKSNGLTGDAGLTVENAGNYVPSSLTGTYSTVNINGTNTKLSDYPVDSLTATGAGKYGMDSGLAYEWVKQTGEKVWVVNAAHGASSITSWQKGAENFDQAIALFSTCQQVLQKEISAGHYTFSHMGYYWNQGCADETKTAEWYVNQYLAMHENLKADLTCDMDNNPATANNTLEFSNIVLVQAGHSTATGYRKGSYEDTTDSFFMTYKELELRGPRVAQIWMANNPELTDIHIVSTLAQDWVTMPDGTDGVEQYFHSVYENGTVDYTTQTKQSASWYTPTTPAAVKDSIHYNQIGYNEIGRESARNTLYILGILEKPQVQTTVNFLNWTGHESVNTIKTSGTGTSDTLVVPLVYPCYESKTVTYTLSDGLSWNFYDLLDTGVDGGILTASIGTQVITVTGREYYSYRFELVDSEMVSVSNDTFRKNLLTATTANTYTLTDTILLKHDKEWVVEFNSVAADRFMALASSKNSTNGMCYFFKSKSGSGVLSIGEYKDGVYQNYGLKQSQINVDWTQPHVYRFQNVINADGTNTIHIYVDGDWVGTATNLIVNDVLKSINNMYLSGKDFAFSSIGCSGFGLANGQMTYLEIHENHHTHNYENGICTTCGEVQPGPVITQQPESVEQEIGKKFAITVEAEGEGLTYQWYVKEAGAKAFKVSVNKTASYAYTMQAYMVGRQVYCVITDANGDSVQTETATITRPPMELKILEQPKDAQQEIGQKFSVKPSVQGDGLTYQWYYKESYMKDFAISSNRSSAYAYTMQSYMHNRSVYCVITDQYGNQVTTDVATITRPPVELKILNQPADVYAAKGEKFSISPKVQGEGLTYQWYYKEGYMKDFKPSSNKTSAYAYSMQTYMNERSVYCVITDKYGNQVQTEVVTIHLEK